MREGETLGIFANLGSAIATEIIGLAGFDWLVVDLEHGAGDEHALLGQLQALSGSPTACLVRVEAIDLPRFMHALDLGADGVVVPRVESAADAQRCVEFCRYSGERGVARYNRAWHWGRAARSLSDVDAETMCVVQIETRAALEAVDEIAAIDGVDVLFVGPGDLAQSLGLACPPDDPRLLAAAASVAEAARRNQKRAGVLVGTVAQVRAYRDLGFNFLGCNSDSGLLASASARLADELRELLSKQG